MELPVADVFEHRMSPAAGTSPELPVPAGFLEIKHEGGGSESGSAMLPIPAGFRVQTQNEGGGSGRYIFRACQSLPMQH